MLAPPRWEIEGQRATAQNCDPAPVFPDMVKKWGLGFMISTEPVPGGRSAGSLAWAGLGNTYFWIDLHRGVAGVILMQLLPFADPKALALPDQFEKAVYAALRSHRAFSGRPPPQQTPAHSRLWHDEA